jgi:hypothetical protein
MRRWGTDNAGEPSLTIQAARSCVDHGITIIAAGWLGELMTFISGHPKQDAALVRAQCAANPAAIARKIVLQKTRHHRAMERLTATQAREAAGALKRAKGGARYPASGSNMGCAELGPLVRSHIDAAIGPNSASVALSPRKRFELAPQINSLAQQQH